MKEASFSYFCTMLDVQYFRLPSEEAYGELFSALRNQVSAETFNEVSVFRNKKTALCRLVGEGMVNRFIQDRTGRHEQLFRFRRGEKGKPYLEEMPDFCFNISHSGDLVVCGFSDKEIGIDIERYGRSRMEVAERFFHPDEIDRLLSLDAEARDRLFIDFWAIKESFLKYLGTGLTRPLSSFYTRLTETGADIYEYGKILRQSVHRCSIDEHYACYVCSESPETPQIAPPVLLLPSGIWDPVL